MFLGAGCYRRNRKFSSEKTRFQVCCEWNFLTHFWGQKMILTREDSVKFKQRGQSLDPFYKSKIIFQGRFYNTRNFHLHSPSLSVSFVTTPFLRMGVAYWRNIKKLVKVNYIIWFKAQDRPIAMAFMKRLSLSFDHNFYLLNLIIIHLIIMSWYNQKMIDVLKKDFFYYNPHHSILL